MHSEMEMFRCSIMRGGTSKAVFIRKNELPKDPVKRDNIIRAIYGSPDIRQIDGLGGADVLTSKLAIISPSTREDADVDYTFGQVGIDTNIVDFGGNCGNISSAVGPFAIDEGLVTPIEPVTTVRIHLTNSDNILIAEVPVKNGKAKVYGDFSIDGCPGTGAKITLNWADVVGGITGKVLPTGKAKDVVEIDGKKYVISIVDAGNPLVFIHAKSLGLKGTETPREIEENSKLMDTIEKIRGSASVKLRLVKRPEDAAKITPYQPFFAIVSEPATYDAFNGKHVENKEIDIVSRLLFMLHMHKTYPITGTVCTGAAACIPGTIVWDIVKQRESNSKTIRIGHPSGVIPVETESEVINGSIMFKKLGVYRTARKIMDGFVYVKKDVCK